jgi:hypothetical protein
MLAAGERRIPYVLHAESLRLAGLDKCLLRKNEQIATIPTGPGNASVPQFQFLEPHLNR